MTIRKLTFTLAAATLALGSTAQAATATPARASAPVGEAEQLGGNAGLIAVIVGIASVLALVAFADGSDGDTPVSP